MLKKRIEQLYIDRIDGKIPEEFWEEKNRLWHAQKDELINKLKLQNENDKKYYECSNTILKFCEDLPALFLGANAEQKRLILNLVCSNFFYKDRELSIEPNSVFKEIAENVILLNGASEGTRTPEYRNHNPGP